MITVLFDIDGTLLRARGAGLAAIQQTMQEMFGVSDLPQVSVHGRTDCGILQDFFKPFGLSFEEHRDAFLESYCRHLRGRLPEFPGHVLPGVVALLERLAGDENMALGLVTGNCRKAAQLKIEHFELTPYFCGLGGYGDNSANRDDVARDAVRAVRNRWPERYDPSHVWVIGDTVNDITCARAISAKAMVVETGGCTAEELKLESPEICLPNLTDIEIVLEALRS